MSPVFAFAVYFVTFLTGYFLNKLYKKTSPSNRYESIDGLRGLLAISVFIHHSYIWYKYLQTGDWKAPDSNFFNQLGLTGVSLFFMISSFLFVSKLLNFKGEKYDWKYFYINRFFRLAPLHIFIVFVIVLIVLNQSNWMLNPNLITFTKSVAKWLGFGVFGFGEINNVQADIINAGVLWSLPYEWLLYFSLPLISLMVNKSKPNVFFIILSLLFIAITIQFRDYKIEHLLSFLGGAIAPFIIKYSKTIKINNILFTLLLMFSTISILKFYSPNSLICKLLITISFTLIALGNDFFGLLKNKTLKFLGELSYSTYLLHGLIIFVLINYVFGFEKVKSLSQFEYCALIVACSPLVIFISFLTYRFIEIPFIKKAKLFKTKTKLNNT